MKLKLPKNQPAEKYVRWLDIDRAIAGISFTSGGVNFRREIFSSAADQVMVQKVTASKKGSISLALNLNRIENAQTRFLAPNKLVMTGNAGGRLTYEVQLTVLNKGGSVSGANGALEVKNADELLILLTAGTSYVLDYSRLFHRPDPHALVSKHMA